MQDSPQLSFLFSFAFEFLPDKPVSGAHRLVELLPLCHQLVHALDVVVHSVARLAHSVPYQANTE